LSDYAIRAEGLSKQYVIGPPRQRYNTLRETLTGAVTGPFRRLKNGHATGPAKDTLWALNDVSFQIGRGEVVGIIGRNGAGKSTLLKILSRITMPSEGRVKVRGRVSSLLEIGIGFHPELTGRENIFLNGAILGMTRSEVRQRFHDIVAFADVERFIDTPVKHYSSGMYMRLAFAIAAHLETDILLVDEVLAVGDASFQQKCLSKMEDVAGHGRTVLFVSHNMTAVQSLCERVIHVEKGQIKQHGRPKDVIQGYLSSATLNQKQQSQLRVGDNLTVINLSLSPNPVESGSDLRFELTLQANAPLRLSEAALLLYALEGPRIGIVDLRPAGFPFGMSAGDRLRVEGTLRSIPLVDRQYRVGLYINSGVFVGNVTDLADLTVCPNIGKHPYARYEPQHRGWVEFRAECSSSIYHEQATIRGTPIANHFSKTCE
jgi:lipopolysaccharide transport system ATP-binding protein